MKINGTQALAIISAVLAIMVASTAQLTDLFGEGVTKHITSAAALVNSVLTSTIAVITKEDTPIIKSVDAA